MVDYINDSFIFYLDRFLVLFTTYICTIILFLRFRNIRPNKKVKIYFVLSSIILPALCQLFGGISYTIVKIIYFLILCISIIITNKKNIYKAIPQVIISFAIALCAEYLCTFLASAVLYFSNLTRFKILCTIISCVLQIILCILLSNIKKIKKCFVYFESEQHAGLGLLLASYVFVFSLLFTQQISINIYWGIMLFAVCPLVLTGLILWIRSIVKRYYKNKLQDRMDKYTQKEMEDKDKRIERLEAEVTALAKQVHRDNHLMTSVDRSVQELAECDSAEKREQIVGEIHTLYMERNDSIAKEQQKNKILPSTGFALIDSSLSELYVKAAARGISFDLTVSEEPYYLVNNIISQTDLQTLLCDHIKDAIIAVESAGITDGRILVTIEKKDSIFEIAIRDNGVDFEADTLARIGKEQVTTHADDGGSGIGFMTTFETLHKTKGSLIITEYEQKTPFSKSVAFVFDGLNRFVISTYRKEELEKGIDRDDLLIL